MISDKKGNLLFYTDGISVWNRQHKLMPNGTGLKGNYSSTQSAMIVPFPGDDNLYYIFTTGAEPHQLADPEEKDFHYNIIDLRQDNGLGDVIAKNRLLLSNVTEKLTAIKHANDRDVWVIVHSLDADTFHTYLITQNGLSPPVISKTGYPRMGPYNTGYLKASPNGEKLVLADDTKQGPNNLVMFDFNRATGAIVNLINLAAKQNRYYGIAFSPDGTKLYSREMEITDLTAFCNLVQYDLAAGSPKQIYDSRYVIFSKDSYDAGALQLGPDGKIYFARRGDYFLDVINFPNLKGDLSGFQIGGLYLGGRRAISGLPNFGAIPIYNPNTIGIIGHCQGEPSTFVFHQATAYDSLIWNFGDLTSGKTNFSGLESPNHTFTQPGTYQVNLTAYKQGQPTIITQSVVIHPPPKVNLGADTVLCAGNSLLLAARVPGGTYLWQDGSNKDGYLVTQPGTYYVKVHINGCETSDTIQVSYAAPVNLGQDMTLCPGNSILLHAGTEGVQYQWQDGSTTSTYPVSKAGSYRVTVTNKQGCTTSDTIKVYSLSELGINLSPDTTLCVGDSLVYRITPSPGVKYLWPDGTSQTTYQVSKPGAFELKAMLNNCVVTHPFKVKFLACRQQVFIPNILTANGDKLNDVLFIHGIDKGIWELEIYNRWGSLIYKNQNYKNDWQPNGGRAGTYYYVLKNLENKATWKGWVEIML